jgi:ribonuclease BN (tRNA processing enzyme)
MLKITILGSGTANLDPNRNAASVLIQRNNINFVYDFGRGTAIQLSKLGLKQADIQHIILSHYHPDHVSDLLPFLHAASWSQIDKRTDELTIYGQPSIYEFMSEFKQPYDDSQFSRGFQTNLIDLPVGDTVIGDELFKITDLHHSYGNYMIVK